MRGQIAWLMPQPEARYGLFYQGVSVISRRDGIVLQAIWGGDIMGYGDDRELKDQAEVDRCLTTIQSLYARMRRA